MYVVRPPMCLPRVPGCFCRDFEAALALTSSPCGPAASSREGRRVFGSGIMEQLAAGKGAWIFGNCSKIKN